MNMVRPFRGRPFLWLLVLVAVACSKQSPEPGPDVLLEVGDTTITGEMLGRWWSRSAPSEDSLQARQASLERLVKHTQAVRRARALGIHDEPAVIEAIDAILIARLRELRLKPALAELEVSETESRAYYEQFKEDQFRVTSRARVAVLWLDTRGIPPLAERYGARLEAIRSQFIENNANAPNNDFSFREAAITHSEHRASRFAGGDIGWVDMEAISKDRWRKAVTEIAATLNHRAEISPVILRPEGAFLVRLIDLCPARFRTYEEVRAKIENLLLTRKQAAVREQFDEWVAAEGPVRLRPDLLASLADLNLPEITRASSSPTAFVPPTQLP